MNTQTEIELSLAEQVDELVRRAEYAIENHTGSAAVRALLDEAAVIRPVIEAESERQRHEVLEASVSREQLAKAKELAELAELDLRRIERAQMRLAKTLAERYSEEAEAGRRQRHNQAEAFRDETAGLILNELAPMMARARQILQQIMTCNLAVDAANEDLPDGAKPLDRPEGHVAGFKDSGSYETLGQLDHFRWTQAVVPDGKGNTAWPPLQDFRMHVKRKGKGFRQNEINLLWRKSQN